jgi:hypothetical protein
MTNPFTMKPTTRLTRVPGFTGGAVRNPRILQQEDDYIRTYKPRYVILAPRVRLGLHRIVITSDSLGEVKGWMERHTGTGHEAFYTPYR